MLGTTKLELTEYPTKLELTEYLTHTFITHNDVPTSVSSYIKLL